MTRPPIRRLRPDQYHQAGLRAEPLGGSSLVCNGSNLVAGRRQPLHVRRRRPSDAVRARAGRALHRAADGRSEAGCKSQAATALVHRSRPHLPGAPRQHECSMRREWRLPFDRRADWSSRANRRSAMLPLPARHERCRRQPSTSPGRQFDRLAFRQTRRCRTQSAGRAATTLATAMSARHSQPGRMSRIRQSPGSGTPEHAAA